MLDAEAESTEDSSSDDQSVDTDDNVEAPEITEESLFGYLSIIV